MPTLTLPTEPRHGAIVSVSLMVSTPLREALTRDGKPVPEAVVARCLIDTGARGSVVDQSVIQRLRISPSGSVLVHTSSTGITPVRCNRYAVDIGIVMEEEHVYYPVKGRVLQVTEMDLSRQDIQGLIGRDVLDQGIFIYDGPRRIATLAF